MNTPAAVFFDLDGTLIDTAPDMGGALNRVLANHNRSLVAAADYRSSVSHGSIALLKLGFPELNLNTDKPDPGMADPDMANPDMADPATAKLDIADLRLEFLATYAEHVADESALFKGVDELLDTLDAHNLPWGIVTNKPEVPTLTLLDALQLTHRCCSIVAADTTTHAKPHPAPMNLACKRANVKPDACFYVGDAERDIQAGRAVAMRTFVAGWGYIDIEKDDTASWEADMHLLQPLDLLDHIRFK